MDEGYDAFIILGIKSILLAKRYGNLARLQIHVQGHMKSSSFRENNLEQAGGCNRP